ncbi:integrase family protein [Sphingomonas sp. AR_OL41]|uniref:tyrosine-type recombinase/integrase n=1 Tax=Sphingomonas sp. AR_OL41 TaxID=3042729 RepID=UPI0024803207|nr:integrase family protein [Sphingomonas sp. AR_OL41]MDH7971074.1 integrase family protein [Sphingomonas sp. AR_OL41]
MAKMLTMAALAALRSGKLPDPQNPGLYIEANASGVRVWKYRRKMPHPSTDIVRMTLGSFPAHSLDKAQKWAGAINEDLEAGVDPRVTAKAAALTVAGAHEKYMVAVEANTHKIVKKKKTGAKAALKQRTIDDKEAIFDRNVKPVIGNKPIGEVTTKMINDLIIGITNRTHKGVQANRTASELRVFFKWCLSLRGKAAGVELAIDPTSQVDQLWNAEEERDRWLDHDELPLFLKALATDDRHYKRALLLFLLTGCRRSELTAAPSRELREGTWHITGERTKNGDELSIKLGPWAQSLINTNGDFIIESRRKPGKAQRYGWERRLKKIEDRMSKLNGSPVEHFTLHDLRRTMRSHVDELVDEAMAERMINHKLTGVKRIYSRNKRADAMAAGFLAWERRLAMMAVEAGVGGALDVRIDDQTQAMPEHPRA